MKKIFYMFFILFLVPFMISCENESKIEESTNNQNEVNEIQDEKVNIVPDMVQSTEKSTLSSIADSTSTPKTKISEENLDVDSDGCIYDINKVIDFESTSLKINKIKLKKDIYYVFVVEFEVSNKTNSTVRWKMHNSGNICGLFSSTTYDKFSNIPKNLGGNTVLSDKDIKTEKCIDGTVPPQSTIIGAVNFLLDSGLGDEKPVLLKNEKMLLTLDYVEDDKLFNYKIELNSEYDGSVNVMR